MSNYCVMCGSPIPDGQNCCSMCYGDPGYGRDGYYQEWLEERECECVEEQDTIHTAEQEEAERLATESERAWNEKRDNEKEKEQ